MDNRKIKSGWLIAAIVLLMIVPVFVSAQTPTIAPIATSTKIAMPTGTPTLAATATKVPVVTATKPASATQTPLPTATKIPTATPTLTAMPTKTLTRTPRSVPTPTATAPTGVQRSAAALTLPINFVAYNRSGQTVENLATIGVRVVDSAGAGVNNVVVSIEACRDEIAMPCSVWESKVSGTTMQLSEDGWIVAPAENNTLYRITCGISTQTQYVDGSTHQLVASCVQTATGVVIESIRVVANGEDWLKDLGIIVIVAIVVGAACYLLAAQ